MTNAFASTFRNTLRNPFRKGLQEARWFPQDVLAKKVVTPGGVLSGDGIEEGRARRGPAGGSRADGTSQGSDSAKKWTGEVGPVGFESRVHHGSADHGNKKRNSRKCGRGMRGRLGVTEAPWIIARREVDEGCVAGFAAGTGVCEFAVVVEPVSGRPALRPAPAGPQWPVVEPVPGGPALRPAPADIVPL